jgi:hypothetical protein
MSTTKVWCIAVAGYEKLKMYGIYVHGCVDGGSNFIVYMFATTNKKAASLWLPYAAAVAQYGRPLRLRADMALEAVPIGQDMLEHMGPGAYLTGRSTANQARRFPSLQSGSPPFASYNCFLVNATRSIICDVLCLVQDGDSAVTDTAIAVPLLFRAVNAVLANTADSCTTQRTRQSYCFWLDKASCAHAAFPLLWSYGTQPVGFMVVTSCVLCCSALSASGATFGHTGQ